MAMNISNDRGGKLKIVFLSCAVLLVANGVIWVFFVSEFPTSSILLSGFSVLGVIVFFRIQLNRIVCDVQLIGNSIFYTTKKKRLEIRKDQILKIGDSGINSVPHEIIIFLHDGNTVEFFPSEKYGNFYRGELKKILQAWLVV
jgi:hypothetical protein